VHFNNALQRTPHQRLTPQMPSELMPLICF
jgi:hypothetical protein